MQPTHGLNFIHDALTAELNLCTRHRSGRNRTITCGQTRGDQTRKPQLFATTIDGNLLITRNLQIAIGQHANYGGGQGAGKQIVGAG